MKKYWDYIITFAITAIAAVLIMVSKKIFTLTETKDVLHVIVDSLFAPGVIIFGIGILVISTNGGTFDMIAFGFIKFIDLFRRDLTKSKYRTFYDYRMALKDKHRSFAYFLIVGGAFILSSLVVLVFYYL